MSVFSLEVFGELSLTRSSDVPTNWIPFQAASRDGRFPDPNVDEIIVVFYSYQESSDYDGSGDSCKSGLVAVHNDRTDPKRLRDHPIEAVDTELELLNRITDIIVEFDPDILAGWEIQTASWGYCDARGKTYGMPTL
jgi:DNA polymerase zeta